ncbi:MAG: ribonuclease HI [Cyclobacteriaceae bacterium]|nr:ribonuclease HI [Cyclobacteriaceae bacterium]
MITLYTDGAAKGNPGPGGYGTVLIFGKHRKELTQGFRMTTNNRMELLAVIAGLEALKTNEYPVTIYSDSKYVVDAINKGWLESWVKKGFKGKKNVDLWQRFLPLQKRFKLTFKWVKGHAGIPENERCDQLAVQSAESSSLLVDEGFENLE